MKKGLIIDEKDNVGVVIEDVDKNDEVEINGEVIIALDNIEMPHKIALKDISLGSDVIKYGEIMGYATEDIKKGSHVHVNNVDSEKIMK